MPQVSAISLLLFFFYSHTHKYSDFRSSLPSLEVIALHYRIDFQCKFYWINMKMEKCLTSPCHTQFSSVQSLSHVWLFATHGLQHTRPPCPSPTPRVYSNSYPLSQWCHPTTSYSVIPFSSCLQSFPASGSFQMSQFFASGGQSIAVLSQL